MAGLVDEPVAAGLAFGVTPGVVVVYDLGGGTLEVTVMEVGDEESRIIATGGDRRLGGFDFDARLMEYAASEVRKLAGPDLLDGGRRQAELRERCEQAKHALSRALQTRLFLSGADRSYTVEVGRDRFERMTQDLLERTAAVVDEVLGRAGVGWARVDRILLVGGSTRMPMVRRMIERRLGGAADTTVDPDQAVALGAAIAARDLTAADRLAAGRPRMLRHRDGELL
ncbi:Hsp70 family protein [Actinoallomurus acaciae]|uniref:Hsp70 family protein n=1 Tax=Actinoallomurus acaciae TaxID=502577 RepID=A0ABV5YNN9_9ACTN